MLKYRRVADRIARLCESAKNISDYDGPAECVAAPKASWVQNDYWSANLIACAQKFVGLHEKVHSHFPI
jgi:hypothetical protein